MKIITGKAPTIFSMYVKPGVKDSAPPYTCERNVINVCYLCTFTVLLYMFQAIMMIITVVVVVIDDDDIKHSYALW